MAIIIFFLKKLKKVEKIGYQATHDFLVRNGEYNTERGFKNQLYIELGLRPYLRKLIQLLTAMLDLHCKGFLLLSICFLFKGSKALSY